ncbi:DNA recombination protein RmuC [Mariprofundus erugo]|uniref:DNA recombination protein RmuC n=1 Tax=Mariprofundus erugo TaxID=2528639 RepID=UPI0010FD4729|nr:DNA recombination protein RmuC [Mariprofundus erugo]TLS77303.1 DNA recombination protein RmuC [Mariprofundus erugo]
MYDIVLLLPASLLLLTLLLWFFNHRQQRHLIVMLQQDQAAMEEAMMQQKESVTRLQQQLSELMIARATLAERQQNSELQKAELENRLRDSDAALQAQIAIHTRQEATIAELTTAMTKERQAAAEKLALLEEARDKLSNEFRLLADRIFEERGKVFSEQNRNSLDEVLKPMREQLGDFRKRMDEVHHHDTQERASLREHLAQLERLNRQMSEDAVGLTQALKGKSKAQGNWGEMILERILETSGLREGREFAREQSFTGEDGRRLRPDVVVYMPGDKQVIIDSKVSLTDYERAVSASDEQSRKLAMSAHARSIKQHIQGLSAKRYDHLPHVHSPDYVLMFVPIEGAYLMAIEEDAGIFESAFELRVAVVTPSTLYATLKLIEQLWRYERQSENVAKLIDRAGKLHDKVVDFVSSFEEIGSRLGQAQKAYDTSMNRIKTGPGNVINQIATLGRLAGKTKKELPSHLTEVAAITDQPAAEDRD